MTFQPRLAVDPVLADAGRRSVRVRRVMELLDLDDSQVRRLIADGLIEAHTVGKRGVRVYWDSVLAYQRDSARAVVRPGRGPAPATPERRHRRVLESAAFREAMATLRRAGIS